MTDVSTALQRPKDKRFRLPTGNWPLLPACVFLLILFVIPVAQMLYLSAFDSEGELSVENFSRLVSTPSYSMVLMNTFSYSAWVTIVCLIFSYPVAYLMATIGQKMRNPLLVWILVPLWTSFLVRALAWMVILGRQGTINHTLISLGITQEPIDLIFNFFGVMVGSVHALMPLSILMMMSVMLSIDQRLMGAAQTLGARPPMGFWRVFFPLSLPGVAASALVVFVTALGFFIAPEFLGSPSDIVLAQVIIVQLQDALNWEFAAALSVVLLVVTMLIVIIFDNFIGLSILTGETQKRDGSTRRANKRAAKIGKSLITVIGWATVWVAGFFRSFVPKTKIKAKSRWVLWTFGLLMVFFLAAPTFFLIPISVSENRYLAWPPSGFTWQWYENYFTSTIWRDATFRSLWAGLATASISMVLGVPAAFVLARRYVPMRSLIIGVLLLPMVLPHIIVAVGIFYLYAKIGLIGTNIGLIIGNAVFALPYVVITMMAVLKNYDQRLDYAAWTLGATKAMAFRRISLPLLSAGLITAFLFAFVKAVDELSIALFVADARTSLLPKQLWEELSYKIDPSLAAVSTLILIIVAIAIFLAQFASSLFGKRRAQRYS